MKFVEREASLLNAYPEQAPVTDSRHKTSGKAQKLAQERPCEPLLWLRIHPSWNVYTAISPMWSSNVMPYAKSPSKNEEHSWTAKVNALTDSTSMQLVIAESSMLALYPNARGGITRYCATIIQLTVEVLGRFQNTRGTSWATTNC